MGDFLIVSGKQGEKVSKLEGASYNLIDGKTVRTPLKSKYVHEEEIGRNILVTKSSIPEVRAGSVVEFRYLVTSDYTNHLPDIVFQHPVPVLYRHATVSVPEFFRFHINMKGFVAIESAESASSGVLSLVHENIPYTVYNREFKADSIPALRGDNYVWSLNDYRSVITFELSALRMQERNSTFYTTSWSAINRSLEKSDLERYLHMATPYKKEIAAIKASVEEPAEQLRAILKLVQERVKWNNEYRLIPENPHKAASEGAGSSGELNCLLYASYREAGFEPRVVLLCPRSYGRMPMTHPSDDHIRTFLVRVELPGGAVVHADATDPYSDLNVLPNNLCVERARLYGDDSEAGWVDLTHLSRGRTLIQIAADLHEDGMLSGERLVVRKGQAALRSRSAYHEAATQEEFVAELEEKDRIAVEEFSFEETASGVKERHRFTMQTDGSDDYRYLNAMLVPFMKENPFDKEERKLPVEFPCPEEYDIRCVIRLPEGYVAEELPASMRLIFDKEGSIEASYVSAAAGNTVQIRFRYAIDRLVYTPAEYGDLSLFFAKLAELSDNPLVVRRNEPRL